MPRFSNAIVNAEAAVIGRALDGGFLRLYATVQPPGADVGIVAQHLAELRFEDPSSGVPVNGVLALSLRPDPDAAASGKAAWFRALRADGTSVVLDGTVDDRDGADLVIRADIAVHARVIVDTLVISVAKE